MLKLKDVFRQTIRNTDPYITGGKYECILVNGERGFLVTNADIGSYHLISCRQRLGAEEKQIFVSKKVRPLRITDIRCRSNGYRGEN